MLYQLSVRILLQINKSLSQKHEIKFFLLQKLMSQIIMFFEIFLRYFISKKHDMILLVEKKITFV